MRLRIGLLMLLAAPAWAQLSLTDAVNTALGKHPSMESVQNRVRAAETRIEQARGGLLPRLSYQESFMTGNNPVYVFSSLLTQRQFTEKNFAIDRLNRPDPLNNFQSVLSVDQTIWDAGQVRSQVRSAELGKSMTAEEERNARMAVVGNVVRTYYGVVLAEEGLRVAQEAAKSAEQDLRRAENVFKAGMATEADVLSIRVHLASVREQEIRRGYELEVARAALNEALGLPLDTAHELSSPLVPVSLEKLSLAEYEKTALAERPEARQVQLASQLAETQLSGARSALWPQIGVRGILEADRQRFVTRGGTNWLIMASLRWNLFDGNANRARIEEARHSLAGSKAQERQVETGIRLQVRKAESDLKSAQERIAVAEAAISMAEESLRITRNRYENGLNTVTDLLRTETALLEARTRRLGAIYEQRVAAAALEQAAGRLSADSPAVK